MILRSRLLYAPDTATLVVAHIVENIGLSLPNIPYYMRLSAPTTLPKGSAT